MNNNEIADFPLFPLTGGKYPIVLTDNIVFNPVNTVRVPGIKYRVYRKHYLRLCRVDPQKERPLLKFFQKFSKRHKVSGLYPLVLTRRNIF